MFQESVSSLPSIWASLYSWFTPAVFFVLLNIMIGTIVFTSTLTNQRQQQRHQDSPNGLQHQQPKLVSSPSVIQRLKSINFSNFRYHEAHSLNSQVNSEPHFSFEATTTQNISSHQSQEKQEINHFFELNQPEKTEENDEPIIYQEQKSAENQVPEEKNEQNADWQSEYAGSGDELPSLDEVYSQLKGRHVSRSKSDTKPAAGEFPKKMKKSASVKSAFKHFEVEDIVEARRPATVKEKSSKATDMDEEVDAKADDFINKFKQQLKLQRLDSIIRGKEMIGRGSGR